MANIFQAFLNWLKKFFSDRWETYFGASQKGLSCVATTFGYQDSGDNGRGAWGANTANPSMIGVSLPIPIVRATMGGLSVQKVRGWTVHVSIGSKHRADVAIVDLGPGKDGKLHGLDMTKGLCDALGIAYPGSYDCTYWIVNPHGDEVPILGANGPRATL